MIHVRQVTSLKKIGDGNGLILETFSLVIDRITLLGPLSLYRREKRSS